MDAVLIARSDDPPAPFEKVSLELLKTRAARLEPTPAVRSRWPSAKMEATEVAVEACDDEDEVRCPPS